MCEKPRVNVKVERGSTLNCSSFSFLLAFFIYFFILVCPILFQFCFLIASNNLFNLLNVNLLISFVVFNVSVCVYF